MYQSSDCLTPFSMGEAPLVLSVEDSDTDFWFIQMALTQCIDNIELLRASDGEQALSLLQVSSQSTHVSRPKLVLLDLNLPRVPGLDVLNFIRSQRLIRDIPVVVFTSSASAQERKDALSFGASEFFTKPSSLDQMLEILNEVCHRYLKAA